MREEAIGKNSGELFSRFLPLRQTPFSDSFGHLIHLRWLSLLQVLLARLNWSHHYTPTSPQVL
jgi:hypothetical protein